MATEPSVRLHGVVHEVDEEERVLESCGRVDRLYRATWGRKKDRVHSVRTTHLLGDRVPMVLYWSKGQWRNAFRARARYVVRAVPDVPAEHVSSDPL